MKKIFVNGLSALDLIHKVDEIPIEISKYKSLETVLSVGGAAHSSIAIQRLGGNSYLSSFLLCSYSYVSSFALCPYLFSLCSYLGSVLTVVVGIF